MGCLVESNSILVPTRPGSVVSWEARYAFALEPGSTSSSTVDEFGAVLCSGPLAIQEHYFVQRCLRSRLQFAFALEPGSSCASLTLGALVLVLSSDAVPTLTTTLIPSVCSCL